MIETQVRSLPIRGWTDGAKNVLVNKNSPIEFRVVSTDIDGLTAVVVGSDEELLEYVRNYPRRNGGAFYVKTNDETLVERMNQLRPDGNYYRLVTREEDLAQHATDTKEQNDRGYGANAQRGRKAGICPGELF